MVHEIKNNYKAGKTLFLLLPFFFLSIIVYSQPDTLYFKISGEGVYSSAKIVPLWLHNNQNGRIKSFGNNQLLTRINSKLSYKLLNNTSIKVGTDIWSNQLVKDFTIGQLYAALEIKHFTFIIGMKNLNYLPGQDFEPAFLNYKNIRPMPAISFGFFDYVPVPFTNNYLNIRGAFLQGKLNENREYPGINKPYYHFKNLYLKSGNLPVNLFVGINHSVIFGGQLEHGTKIPVDWINTYLAKSSEKFDDFNPGEGLNAPGEHVGFSEYGFFFENNDLQLSLSKQDPMTDGSGLFHSKDKIINFSYQSKQSNAWIKKFSYQYSYTKHQSGPGLHLNGYKNVEDYSQFMKDNFNIDAEINTWEEFLPYLKKYINKGYRQFGRDNYYNHGIYKLGHFYDDHFFGYPLMHSKQQISYFDEIDGFNYSTIGNNRLYAHHFSIEGTIANILSYKGIATFSNNFGTYRGYYTNGFNEREYYYFKNGKKQNYYLLKLSKKIYNTFTFHTSVGLDTGSLYKSWGIKAGICWDINVL